MASASFSAALSGPSIAQRGHEPPQAQVDPGREVAMRTARGAQAERSVLAGRVVLQCRA
jgi:hypothetical protein